MDHIFRKTYTVTDNATDRFDRLRPSMLLFFVQDAATSHCAGLGMDWDSMAAKGMFWAVTRTKAEIYRLPRHGETVTVETWPMATTRVAYPRATAIYDAQGELLARTVSLWVLMDIEKRSMILPGKSGLDFTGADLGTELKPPLGLPSITGEAVSHRTVHYSDLDINGHLNNCRYLDWVDDLTDSEFHRTHSLREMVICYIAEAREGQTLTQEWTWNREDGTLLVQFGREENRVFSGKLSFNVM